MQEYYSIHHGMFRGGSGFKVMAIARQRVPKSDASRGRLRGVWHLKFEDNGSDLSWCKKRWTESGSLRYRDQ